MLRLTRFRIFGGLLLLVLGGFGVLWLKRVPIADAAIRSALEARGVRAAYDVKSIGLRWERIENLKIGNPEAPDLSADWAEIRVSTSLSGLVLTAIRAGGVRLRGRLINGRLSFGNVDKLLAGRDVTAPYVLPDLEIDVRDARMLIDSKWGQFASRIDGAGNLTDGFRGKLAAIAPALQRGDCRASRVTAFFDVRIRQRKPTIKGPLRADAVVCSDFAVAKPTLAIAATLDAELDRWRGKTTVSAAGVQATDAIMAKLSGEISFEGTAADTNGIVKLAADAGRLGTIRAARLAVDGRYSTKNGVSGNGQARVARMMPDARRLIAMQQYVENMGETPIAPIAKRLIEAGRRASSGISAVATGAFFAGGGTLSNFNASSASGAMLKIDGGRGVRFGRAGVMADTQITLSGGGFPTVVASLRRQADGNTTGLIQMAPYRSGIAQVALAPVKFAARQSGAMRFETMATLDGPIFGGKIQGVRLSLNMTFLENGVLVFNDGCTRVSLQALSAQNFTLGPATWQFCPLRDGHLLSIFKGRVRGGTIIMTPRLNGKMGQNPVILAADSARVDLTNKRFLVNSIDARLGGKDRLSRIELGMLSGQVSASTILGRFEAMSGQVANVPLLIEQAAGTWAVRNNALTAQAKLKLRDQFAQARLNPLVSNSVNLRFASGQIDARGVLRLPDSDVDIAQVDITHSVETGNGTATLAVRDLQFGDSLQPEELTRLTLGVVANVVGAVSGRGVIRWTADGVTSGGEFQTQGLDLAAAFGPVKGLSGKISFHDLLGLATPPGQQIKIDSINPGTIVKDGVIRYQLLPDQRVSIESGAWPFAGGDLLLDPAIIDMREDRERKLTFRVVGLDAAKFIQQLEFDNLAATGIFDGVMPMYFDENGGRIEAGRLVVRRNGGTLAYVGDVSNTAMNIYAKLAFDALKSIRYRTLTIALNGPLDGEIISQIRFDGINEAPLAPPKNLVTRQFIGLPFVFNIKLVAPFRSLLNTARTFQDPSALIKRTTPEMRKSVVQPSESDKN